MNQGALSFVSAPPPSEELETMLQQELAIAEYKPSKGSLLYVMSNETEALLPLSTKLLEERNPEWKEQRQIALWANQILLDNWRVNAFLDEDGIPLYFFIVNCAKDRVEMKGLWKSLYGTLHYKSLGKPFPKGNAFALMQQTFAHLNVLPGRIVHVTARASLERLLKRHNIRLNYIERRFPKRQGAAVIAHFIWQ